MNKKSIKEGTFYKKQLDPFIGVLEIEYLCRMSSIEVVRPSVRCACEREGLYISRTKDSNDNIVKDAATESRLECRAR